MSPYSGEFWEHEQSSTNAFVHNLFALRGEGSTYNVQNSQNLEFGMASGDATFNLIIIKYPHLSYP